jgi:hypothetical protein
MALNTQGKLEITDLDFDTIKTNLKTYLKGQTEFTDYDFEGSGMSVLLDVLAYNTHYNAFMANMLANEMFLDTAVKRNSVVSHAKRLGYTPVSAKTPIAYLDVTVDDATSGSLTLSAGHAFQTTVSGIQYQFVAIDDATIQPDSGIYTFSNLPVYEGTYVTTKYTVNISDAAQRFILDNNNIDISTLSVTVQTSSTDTTTTTYTIADNIVDIVDTTTAFFTQETTDEEWEVYFGDGIIGKALIDGNIITMSYVVTNKADANGASTFTSESNIGGNSVITVVTATAAAGGAEADTLDAIKYNAPFSYSAQNRAVTAADYKAIVPQIYSNVQSIAVWGGEHASPAVYGKVYISIRPKTGTTLTAATKNTIITKLNDYKVASVTVEIEDPITIKIIPIVNFKFDNSATTKTSSALETLITAAINTFSDDNLEKFEGIFRHSKFASTIDDVDTSILSNITTIKISRSITPTLSAATKYTVSFNNALHDPDAAEKQLSSTGFIISGNANTLYLDDDGAGVIRTYYLVASARTYVDTAAGTIDYDTGEIILTSFNITSVSNSDDTITLTVLPSSNDIVPVRNQILEIDSTNMSVTGAEDTIASGASNAGVSYTTTTSYSQ